MGQDAFPGASVDGQEEWGSLLVSMGLLAIFPGGAARVKTIGCVDGISVGKAQHVVSLHYSGQVNRAGPLN